MSALLKSLAEVSKNAFRKPNLQLVHSAEAAPSAGILDERARAEKYRKIALIALGSILAIVVIAFAATDPLLKKLRAANTGSAALSAEEIEQQKIQMGAQSYASGSYAEALKIFHEIYVSDPNSATNANNFALANKSLGNLKYAKEIYLTALKKFPTDSVLLNNIAILEFQHGSQANAEAYLKKAIAQRSGYKEAMINLAHLYELSGNWQGALVVYEQYLEMKNGDANLVQKLKERIRKIHSLSQMSKNGGERI